MANLRQSILVRTDLQLPVGLLAAQVAHIHMETLRQYILINKQQPFSKSQLIANVRNPQEADNIYEWMVNPYIFVHAVPNLEVLEYFKKEANNNKIQCTIWDDTIFIDISKTQRKAFDNCIIGMSLGPCDSDQIKTVIGDLPLL